MNGHCGVSDNAMIETDLYTLVANHIGVQSVVEI
jgi:hypothetical protein